MMNNSLAESDIRYRGIFTDRGLRLLALFAMTCSQVSSIALLAAKAAGYVGETIFPSYVMSLLTLLKNFGAISIPLLLISSLASVLDGRETFGKMILSYFILAVISYLGIIWFLTAFLDTTMESMPTVVASFVNSLQLDKVPHALLTSALKMVFPGDGSFHPEAFSTMLSGAGISVMIPSEEELVSIFEFLQLDTSIPKIIYSLAGSIDAEQAALVLENAANSLMNFLHLNIETIWEYVRPSILRMIHSRLNLNVFWDLFLYTTFFYFVCYKPKNCKGGLMILFRACAVLPGGWLLISAMISGNIRMNGMDVPDWFVASLSGCNLASLSVFFLLVLFEKYREAEYLNRHAEADNWQKFQDSNRSSLQFSIYAALVMIVVSLFDYLLGKIPNLTNWHIGTSSHMWIAAPFLLLFSYNRKPKYKIFNAVVPIYYIIHYFIVVFVAAAVLIVGINKILGTPVI